VLYLPVFNGGCLIAYILLLHSPSFRTTSTCQPSPHKPTIIWNYYKRKFRLQRWDQIATIIWLYTIS
jgi:hypothetical protein